MSSSSSSSSLLSQFNIDVSSSYPVGSSFSIYISNNPSLFGIIILYLQTNSLNTLTKSFFKDIKNVFNSIKKDINKIKCVLFTHKLDNKYFTAGLDLKEHKFLLGDNKDNTNDPSRVGYSLYNNIKEYQESIKIIEEIPQPVIMCIHGVCIGGGIDIMLTCDIRYCTSSSVFSIAEINIGMTADLGTIQRIQKLSNNNSKIREYCYTGRVFSGKDAQDCGLISHIENNNIEIMEKSLLLCEDIAKKSQIGIWGIKKNLNYSREHTVEENFEYVNLWNSIHLQNKDMNIAIQATFEKQKPIFAKL